MLQAFGIVSHPSAVRVLNVVICGELVLAAMAQAIAFSFNPFIKVEQQRRAKNFFKAIGDAVRVDDVIEDA